MPRIQGAGGRVALAVLAGLLHGACFPPFGAWWFAFGAFAPLVVAIRDTRPGRGAVLGWVAGTVGAAIAGTPALTVGALAYFGPRPWAAVGLATLLGQVFHAVPTAVFGAMATRLVRLRTLPGRVGALAAAWTGLEFVRTHGLHGGGSPWDLLAHPLYAHPLWIQLADLGGIPLVSFAVMAVAAALSEVPARGWAAAATAAVVLGVMTAYGGWRLAGERDGAPALRLALVQGNVPDDWRVDAARAADGFKALSAATRPLLAARPALVVWPENAISVLVEPNIRFADGIATLLGPDGPPLLLGGPRVAQTAPGRAEFYNSAYLFAPGGETLGVYDKRRPVPIAEYAPIARVPGLGWRLDAPGDYSAGTTATIFTTPVPFGVLICFEGIYADLARDLVRGGARLLVNISNDAWFDGSAGNEQAFAMTVFRAVETRRALVRVTTTGVTGVVGPSGRILARFPAGVRGGWPALVPVRGDGETPAIVLGDAFAWLALGGALVAWGWAGRRARGAPEP